MNNYVTPIKVGAVLLIGIISFVVFVFKSSESPITGAGGYTVSVVFDNAMGLVRKSRVMIAGISIGEIQDIKLENGKARVYLKIKKDIPLYSDASVRKVQESILGTSLIEVSSGTSSNPPLKDGDEIKYVLSSPDIKELMEKMGGISEDVKAITSSLKDIMDSNDPDRGSLRKLVDNLTRMTGTVDSSMDMNINNVGKILANAERISSHVATMTMQGRREVIDILGEIKALTESLKTLAASQGGKVDQSMDKVQVVLEKVDTNLQKLDKILTHAGNVAEDIDDGKGPVGTLIRDEKVADNIKTITGSAAKYVKKLDELQTWFHVQSDFYPRQISAKTAVSLKLIPRKNKYYMISVVDDPRGRTRKYRTLTKTTDSNKDAFIREDKTITSYSLKLSLMYAQRISFATFRFGLMENSGGFGLDLEFFKDILKFRTDLYELTSGATYPRLKSQINVELWRHLFIAGGVDDIINESRDYFVGGGIQFSDEDLKTLLSSGAGGAAAGAMQ